MRSVMEHSFAEVPRVDIPRSSFNRSHGHKTTFDADYLVPILVDDIIPGDTFSVDAHFFARLASPTLYTLFDNLYLDTFFFFVPYRLVWPNWVKMHGAQDDPGDSIDYTVPAISSATTVNMLTDDTFRNLCDYMGLPRTSSVDLSELSALPLRAYNLIWNEWFRDQNLQDSVPVHTDDGPDNASTDYNLLKRGKRHDYFTAALPWPQKGDAVDVGGTLQAVDSVTAGDVYLKLADYGTQTNVHTIHAAAGGSVDWAGGSTDQTALIYSSGMEYALTINELRLAMQTQRLLERDARSGTRYNEMILAHFGVTVPDFRVQRPEFLGGGSTPIQMQPVAQTTYQGTQTLEDAKGALSSIGTASGKHGFTKSFVEHGVLIGLANVRGDITYSQGVERYWSKQTRYDFYYPVLAQIGEQAIYNREIFYQNTVADDDVFGYIPRYDEYRYKPSRLSSLMRVDHASSLSAFHLSEDFSALPTLGASFIQANTGTPLDRAIAVPSQPHMLVDFYFDMKCARPMPVHGVPGNLDHF